MILEFISWIGHSYDGCAPSFELIPLRHVSVGSASAAALNERLHSYFEFVDYLRVCG